MPYDAGMEKFEREYPSHGSDLDPPDIAACDSLQALLEQNDAAIMMERAGEEGFVSIHEAAAVNDVEALRYYLDSGVPPDWATYSESTVTPVEVAIQYSNMEVAQLLIDRGADVKVIATKSGRWHATNVDYPSGAEEQRNNVVKLLLERLKTNSEGYFGDRDVRSSASLRLPDGRPGDNQFRHTIQGNIPYRLESELKGDRLNR
jgi:hypothetical protein